MKNEGRKKKICASMQRKKTRIQTPDAECSAAQHDLRTTIAKQEEITEARINRLIEKAKTDPNVIWQTRKRNRINNKLEYDTITEGTTLTDPDESRNYIDIKNYTKHDQAAQLMMNGPTK